MDSSFSLPQKVKIFADGADYDSTVQLAKDPKIRGFTTNPSLMKKAGVKEYAPFCQRLLKEIGGKPISFEVFADDFETMGKQAQKIATWGENVYVKIPVTNSKGESSLPLIQDLAYRRIKLNITAVFTLKQVLQVASALKGGAPSIISVFAGRVADTGRDPLPLMMAAAGVCTATDKNIELLWASTREIFNVVQAEQSHCHIITVPHNLLGKMANFGRDLSQCGLETVQAFKDDAEAAGYHL